MLLNPKLIALLGLALLLSALTAWGFFERSRYQSCRADVERLTAQAAILADKIKDQNAAVSELEKKASAAKARGAQAAKVAQGATEAHAALLRAVEGRIARPEGKSCADALTEIRRGV